MVAYLSQGTYTVETAAPPGRSGQFNLRALQGPPPWRAAEECVGTIPLSRNGTRVDGTWEEPCWSSARGGRLAKWYTFEVTERSQVTMTLKSERINSNDDWWASNGADTYVYLRGGRNFTGWAIAENDDDNDNDPNGIWHMRRGGWHWTSSAVDRVWLEPGTYTIEATTTTDVRLTEKEGPFSITFQRMD